MCGPDGGHDLLPTAVTEYRTESDKSTERNSWDPHNFKWSSAEHSDFRFR